MQFAAAQQGGGYSSYADAQAAFGSTAPFSAVQRSGEGSSGSSFTAQLRSAQYSAVQQTGGGSPFAAQQGAGASPFSAVQQQQQHDGGSPFAVAQQRVAAWGDDDSDPPEAPEEVMTPRFSVMATSQQSGFDRVTSSASHQSGGSSVEELSAAAMEPRRPSPHDGGGGGAHSRRRSSGASYTADGHLIRQGSSLGPRASHLLPPASPPLHQTATATRTTSGAAPSSTVRDARAGIGGGGDGVGWDYQDIFPRIRSSRQAARIAGRNRRYIILHFAALPRRSAGGRVTRYPPLRTASRRTRLPATYCSGASR